MSVVEAIGFSSSPCSLCQIKLMDEYVCNISMSLGNLLGNSTAIKAKVRQFYERACSSLQRFADHLKSQGDRP